MVFKRYKKEDLKEIDNIGIIMWGILGDVLLRTPVLKALKDIYPHSSICAIVDPIGKTALKNNPYVDNIIIFDRDRTHKINYHLNKISSILKVRQKKFDLIIDLYNGGSSPIVMITSNAKYRLGFCNHKRSYIYNVKNECSEDRLKQRQRLSNYMISIVEAISEQNFSLKPIFTISKTSFNKMENYINDLTYDIDKLYTLNLGSGDINKMLDFQKSFNLVKYIYDTYGFIPLIISNPKQEFLQEEFIDKFMNKSNIPYIKLDTLSLEEVASIIKLTKFIITPDTSIMHLALAGNNFIYTIFTYTHPVFVDPNHHKFISVYQEFDSDKLYQYQDITLDTLYDHIDLLFNKMS
jgi:heptosyltransferase-1